MLWIAYLLSRTGVGDRQLWLIKYLVRCIVDYCSLIFNLDNLYAMLYHGGDAELTQLWGARKDSSVYTRTRTHICTHTRVRAHTHTERDFLTAVSFVTVFNYCPS